MSHPFRIALLILALLGAALFGWKFKSNYDIVMARRARAQTTDLTDVRMPDERRAVAAPPGPSLGGWGAGLILSLLGAGLLVAHEVSQYFGSKAAKAMYDEDQTGPAEPDYEEAEQAWTRGDFLGAIHLLRDYLQKNPREQHVALRIAEIYEKDLNNPLAAALEYEEVLQQKLPAERWGWAAIHLCNLYAGRLNQPEKAIQLLQQIDARHPEIAAAEKARSRLAQLAAEGVIPPVDEPPPPAAVEPPEGKLPPGFAPKKR